MYITIAQKWKMKEKNYEKNLYYKNIYKTKLFSINIGKSDNEANALFTIKHVQNGIDKLCAYKIKWKSIYVVFVCICAYNIYIIYVIWMKK